MAKLPSPTGKELIAALQKIGFAVVRQKGSHVRLKHEDDRVVTIPVHARKPGLFHFQEERKMIG